MSASGGCQCGAVRYRVDGDLGTAGVCHCRMCQKAGGNFGFGFVTAPGLRFTRGEPGTFRSSPKFERGFCEKCGTPLFMRMLGDPLAITIGSLDEPDSVGPIRTQIGIEGRCRWFTEIANAPAATVAEGYPPEKLDGLVSFQHPDHDTDRWPSAVREAGR